MIHFKLYSRSYCHLCDDMLHALKATAGKFDIEIEVIDVDSDEQLIELYDELVPVLTGSTSKSAVPVQLCHYFLDKERVMAFLHGANSEPV